MTTETEEKKHPDIALSPVESSQIHAIGHDAASNILAVQFKGKSGPTSTYHYANFTAEDFRKFREAESIGAHFGKHRSGSGRAFLMTWRTVCTRSCHWRLWHERNRPPPELACRLEANQRQRPRRHCRRNGRAKCCTR